MWVTPVASIELRPRRTNPAMLSGVLTFAHSLECVVNQRNQMLSVKHGNEVYYEHVPRGFMSGQTLHSHSWISFKSGNDHERDIGRLSNRQKQTDDIRGSVTCLVSRWAYKGCQMACGAQHIYITDGWNLNEPHYHSIKHNMEYHNRKWSQMSEILFFWINGKQPIIENRIYQSKYAFILNCFFTVTEDFTDTISSFIVWDHSHTVLLEPCFLRDKTKCWGEYYFELTRAQDLRLPKGRCQ